MIKKRFCSTRLIYFHVIKLVDDMWRGTETQKNGRWVHQPFAADLSQKRFHIHSKLNVLYFNKAFLIELVKTMAQEANLLNGLKRLQVLRKLAMDCFDIRVCIGLRQEDHCHRMFCRTCNCLPIQKSKHKTFNAVTGADTSRNALIKTVTGS